MCLNTGRPTSKAAKKLIKEIVRRELKERTGSLVDVKNSIAKEFGSDLSTFDHAFIERKYFYCCMVLWLEETTGMLSELLKSNKLSHLQEVMSSIAAIRSLSEVSGDSSTSAYYRLLMDSNITVNDQTEWTVLSDFKCKALEQIQEMGWSASIEMKFVESFLDLLASSKDYDVIIDRLKLREFCTGNLPLSELLQNIEDMGKLPEMSLLESDAHHLKSRPNEELETMLREAVKEYVKPVMVETNSFDNRKVLTVKGKVVIVSAVLRDVEKALSTDIEEVHFIAGHIMHVDAALENEIWHGKNLVVVSKRIKVYGRIHWDLSGLSATQKYQAKADTDTNGDGEPGQDGYAGGSGGNVLILTEDVDYPEKWWIKSVGGNGSDGQDGGNGRNGKDGAGITFTSLESDFHSPVMFASNPFERKNAYDTMLSNIKDISSNIQEREENSRGCFVKAETSEGNEIVYSYCGGGFTVRFQSYFLFKGSPGEAGGRGGSSGFGGQGGFGGEIKIVNLKNINEILKVTKITTNGKDGSDGTGGLYGIPGKNGWDMGYVDYQTWKSPLYYGKDKASKCTISYYEDDNSPSTRVWCSYNERYAEITSSRITHIERSSEQRQTTRAESKREVQAVSTKKKTISQKSVETEYCRMLHSTGSHVDASKLTELKNISQNAQSALNQVAQERHSQMNQSRVQRKVNFNRTELHLSTNVGSLLFSYTPRPKAITNFEQLFEELKHQDFCVETWKKVQEFAINHHDLSQLIALFENNTTNQSKLIPGFLQTKNPVITEIKTILTEKYQFATLERILKKLQIDDTSRDNTEDDPVESAGFLIPLKEISSECVLIDSVLGGINDYFVENLGHRKEKIQNYLKDQMEQKRTNNLNNIFKSFIIEACEQDTCYKTATYYYNKYNTFVKTMDEDLFGTFKDFIQALGETYDDPTQEWIEANRSQSRDLAVKDLIEYSPLAKTKYENFQSLAQLKYDWNESLNNKDLHKEFVEYKMILAKMDMFKKQEEIDKYYDQHLYNSKKTNEATQAFCTKYVPNEADDIQEIMKHFPDHHGSLLKFRLEKIKSEFIGNNTILHFLARRFCVEGMHITFLEVCYLINSILKSVTQGRNELNMFCWIVSAYQQTHWINELILLDLENHLRLSLSKKAHFRELLLKIEDPNILLLFKMKLDQAKRSKAIKIDEIENIFKLLSEISSIHVPLQKLSLSEWPFALKEKYWTQVLVKLTDWASDNGQLDIATYYLSSLENLYGTSLVERFLEVIFKKKEEILVYDLITILQNFHSENWVLTSENLKLLQKITIKKWIDEMQKIYMTKDEERKVNELIELIRVNTNTSKAVSDKLSVIKEWITKAESFESKNLNKIVRICSKKDIEEWTVEFKNKLNKKHGSEKQEFIEESYTEIIAVIDRAIELVHGFTLRDTQKLSILSFLAGERNILAQVATGEGKSLIVVGVSIVKALFGEKIDIITSSSVLAKRDAENSEAVFKLFNINVSHNCSEDVEKRRAAYSNYEVVYGDLSNFQRDYLLDRFYGENILGDRNFQNIIIDEVDSMLLDKGNNILYLSHDLAGLDKLASIYLYIWQWISLTAVNIRDGGTDFLDPDEIKEAIQRDLFGLITKKDIAMIDSKLNVRQIDTIWNSMIDGRVIDKEGRLLVVSKEDMEQLPDYLPTEMKLYKQRLDFYLKERIERERLINVPNYLLGFVDRHLNLWIQSAIHAFLMKVNEDYVVDVDRTGTSHDINPNITILDLGTGTDQANSQWDEALHQFLQLKHGCRLSMQSLKAVFISNVSYFKLYTKLYGLTGTLGSERERNLLKDVHSVDFVTIPTVMPKKFREENPILCDDKKDWERKIVDEAKNYVSNKHRSMLVICETINDVKSLEGCLKIENVPNIHTYTRDYEEFDFAQGNKELEQGHVIISTNLASRGTDIKVTDELSKAGGLHVCLTYLSDNIRIEQQAFGRSARKGDAGSGRLIIINAQNSKHIFEIKKNRDIGELQRISNLLSYYENQIMIEEKCFKQFRDQYEGLKEQLNTKKVPEKVQKVLLQSRLDKWAFWLDDHSKFISEQAKSLDSDIIDQSLSSFIAGAKHLEGVATKDWLGWVAGLPVQMVKLGKILAEDKQYTEALELFDKVIQDEPHFSEVAHYLKAFVLIKQINWAQKPLKDAEKEKCRELKKALRTAAKLLNNHSKFAMNACAIIRLIKQKNPKSILQIDSFEKQQKNLSNFYELFSNSIEKILGKFVTTASISRKGLSFDQAELLYEELLRSNVLKPPRITKNIQEDHLTAISNQYGVPVDIMRSFLSKHQGKVIKVKEFEKEMKRDIRLAGREDFWNALLQDGILDNHAKYVIVDNGKLNTEISQLITEKVDCGKLKPHKLTCAGDRIVLHVEHLLKENSQTFSKSEFKKVLGEEMYQKLKKTGALSSNRTATINLEKAESNYLSACDSLKLENFGMFNIPENDAKHILSELEALNIIKIEKDTDCYRLTADVETISKLEIKFCPVYQYVTKVILHMCFAYRIALQKILKDINGSDSANSIHLHIKPYKLLLSFLSDLRVLKLATIAKDQDDVKKLLKDIIDNDFKKSKNEINKKLFDYLRTSMGTLKELNVSDCDLKPLDEMFDCKNFGLNDEMFILYLSGLDVVLSLGKRIKKWTKRMLFNTAIVGVLALTQIAAGVALTLCSAATATYFGSFLISEGISDLLFGVSALISGQFSWGDYGRHKIQSILITSTTCGLGAMCSPGSKAYQFSKAVAANVDFTSSIVKAGVKKTVRQAAKYIIQVASLCVANKILSDLVEMYVKSLSKTILSKLVTSIRDEINDHDLHSSLSKLIRTTGETECERIWKEMFKKSMDDTNYVEEFVQHAKQITDSTTSQVFSVLQKIAIHESEIAVALALLKKLVQWTEYRTSLEHIKQITKKLLDTIKERIDYKIEELRSQPLDIIGFDKTKLKNMDNITKGWMHQIVDQAHDLAEEYITDPILENALKHFSNEISNDEEQRSRLLEETEDFQEFQRKKEKFQNSAHNPPQDRKKEIDSDLEKYLKDEYDEYLMNLLTKTRNPSLFAAIVRENVPMDLTCVKIATRILENILAARGIRRRVSITVIDENGLFEKISSDSIHADEELVISVYLIDNHFQISEENVNQTDITSSNSRNNCLYEALCHAVPELNKMTSVEFRSLIADYIEREPDIQEYIINGLHQVLIRYGVYGGAIREITIPTKKLRKKVRRRKLRFSQSSIATHTSGSMGRERMHLTQLADQMTRFGYQGEPITAVNVDGALVVLDHRRVVAALIANSDSLEIKFRVYGLYDVLSPEDARRYGAESAKDALKRTMNNGSLDHFITLGFPSDMVRLRLTGYDYDYYQAFLNLASYGFIIGPRKFAQDKVARNQGNTDSDTESSDDSSLED